MSDARLFLYSLGNPSKKYTQTRHNTGFLVADWLAPLLIDGFIFSRNDKVLMNDSGREVLRFVEKNKIPLARLVVIHDDLDIPLGDFRLQFGRGSAGHNGVASVISALGSRRFWRLRVGIGRPADGKDSGDFVLERFLPAELEKLRETVPKIASALINLQESKDA